MVEYFYYDRKIGKKIIKRRPLTYYDIFKAVSFKQLEETKMGKHKKIGKLKDTIENHKEGIVNCQEEIKDIQEEKEGKIHGDPSAEVEF